MGARGDDEQGPLRLTGEGGDKAGFGAIGEADGRGRRGNGERLQPSAVEGVFDKRKDACQIHAISPSLTPKRAGRRDQPHQIL